MTAPGAAARGAASTWVRAAERVLPPLVIAFLLYAPQWSALGAVRNRYFLFWGREDTLAMLACVLLLGAAGTIGGLLVDRLGSPALRTTRDVVFLLCCGLALVANLLPVLHVSVLVDYLRHNRSLARALLVGVSSLFALGWGAAIVWMRPRLLRAARATCLILSPLLLFVGLPALGWESWERPVEPIRAPARATAPGTPVYVMVFDEWSFARSTRGDDFLRDLPHLRDLRSRSTFFTSARSPSGTTYLSLPRILFQSQDDETFPHVFVRKAAGHDEEQEQAIESITPARGARPAPPSLFDLARGDGYATFMLGFYLPYRDILGDAVDVCRSHSDYPAGGGFLGRMALHTFDNPQYWRIPLLAGLWKQAYASVFSRHWADLNATMQAEARAMISVAPERSFVFVHFPSPHAPFVLEADGSYVGPFPIHSGLLQDVDVDVMDGTPQDYARGLRHMDGVVGDLVQRLKDAGRFDDALLILTGDHAWRIDTDGGAPPTQAAVRHVPLLIKLPRQASATTVDPSFDLIALKPLLEAVMKGDAAGAAAAIPPAHPAS